MPIPYSTIAIANSFIALPKAQGGIEHMKLQKLVYCAYGWHLAVYGLESQRLTTEGPEIWKHGPVFDSLYHAFKIFGRKPITSPQASNPFAQPETVDENDEEINNLVSWIWGRYGHLSGFALSDLTHKPGTPWHRVAVERGFRVDFNTRIPDKYIYEEFSELLDDAEIAARNQEAYDDRRRQPA